MSVPLRFLSGGIDLNQGQLHRATLESVTSDPMSPTPVVGRIIFRTDFGGVIKIRRSTSWDVVWAGQMLSGTTGVIVGNPDVNTGQIALSLNLHSSHFAVSNNQISIANGAIHNALVRDDAGILFSKLQTVSPNRVLGRGSTSGPIQELPLLISSDSFAGASDMHIATSLATKNYVDGLISGLGRLLGNYDLTAIGTLSGTVASSGLNVTGTGTSFTTQLRVGNIIHIGGQNRVITAILSNTHLTVDTAFSPTINPGAGYTASLAFPTTTRAGDYWVVTAGGTLHGVTLNPGDMIIARQANPDNTNPLHYIFLESNRDAATTASLGLVRLATLDDIQGGTSGAIAITPDQFHTWRTSARIANITRYNLGDAVNSGINVTIPNSLTALIQVFDSATREVVYPRIIHVNATTVRFEFGFVPTVEQFYAIISTT